MTEQQFQTKVIKFLNERGIYNFKTITCNRSGIPDIVGCYRGRFFTIEVKAENGKQSALQKLEQERITESMGIYLLLYPEKNWKEQICNALSE